MTRVRCPHNSCVFWDSDYCGAEEIELDPEQLTCLTMEELEDAAVTHDEDEWVEDAEEDEWEEDEEEEDEWEEDEEEEWGTY